MARQVGSSVLARILPRPYALAGRPQELPAAFACVLALVVVFIADAATPVQVALSALGLIPLLTAMWLFGLRLALAVGAVAVVQLLVTGFLGALNPLTVASELTAYLVLAVVCRLYAGSLADLLSGAGRRVQAGRTGGRLPAITLKGAAPHDNLTRRERQVARLAAQGYTAREIGAQLHIGKRTVETHLANAYDKLGVRSKRELIQSTASSSVSPTTES